MENLKHGPSEWQDIATAPKDGTNILACATWVSPYGQRCVISWVANGYLDGTRWTFSSFDLDEDEYSPPTHWMPLPDPPAPLTGGRENG